MTEDFLSRWSRRKLAENGGEAETDAAEPVHGQAPADPSEEGEEPVDGERVRHPAEDVDIDALTKDSDFTVFMQKGVPAALKRKALRKLWASDPVFANLDGLDDYFDIAKPKIHGMGPMRGTSWQIGRGFLSEEEIKRAMGLADEVAEAAAPDEATETAAEEGAAGGDRAGEPGPDDVVATDETASGDDRQA